MRADNSVIAQEVQKPYMSHIQEVWLHTLEFCESRGMENLKFLDSNDRYSYGILQFQMESFLREGKKYNILDKNITKEEAQKEIYNVGLQEQIANQMLLNGGESNWFNCYSKKIQMKYPKN